MLSLKQRDVSFSCDNKGSRFAVLRLGAGSGGTKAKREQFAILRESSEPAVYEILATVCASTSPGDTLFQFTLSAYRKLLKLVAGGLRLPFDVGAHGPRAGFASDGIAEGRSFSELKEGGRWKSDASFRTYIDVITSLSVAADLDRLSLSGAVAWILYHNGSFYPVDVFDAGRRVDEEP